MSEAIRFHGSFSTSHLRTRQSLSKFGRTDEPMWNPLLSERYASLIRLFRMKLSCLLAMTIVTYLAPQQR
jgi:hypothetical protein